MIVDDSGILIDPLFHDFDLNGICVRSDQMEISLSSDGSRAMIILKEISKFGIRNITDDAILLNIFVGELSKAEKSGEFDDFFWSLLTYSGENIDDITINRIIQENHDMKFFDIHFLHGGRISVICREFEFLNS